MSRHFIDIGHLSLKKHGEQFCGDQVKVEKTEDGTTIMVLADGLGSGVKACILSTLTAKIITTMMSRSMSIEDCVATMAATLPVCEERKIAYSTFTIIKIQSNLDAEIIQYDNPRVIVLRNGKNKDIPLMSMEIEEKLIYCSKITLQENDVLIAMSDGVEHAGQGNAMNFDWQRNDIIEFMEKKQAHTLAAKTIATILLDECGRLYEDEPADDATVCVIKPRARHQVNLLIGPPQSREDDLKMMSLFFAKEGHHVICGGTSAEIAARFLRKKLTMDSDRPDPAIPPICRLEGADLVTEGLVTIAKVLDHARDHQGDNANYFDWSYQQDGASRIARLLFEEATDVCFYVGRAENPAHKNPDLPRGFNDKMRLVDDLAACLKEMGKHVKVSHF